MNKKLLLLLILTPLALVSLLYGILSDGKSKPAGGGAASLQEESSAEVQAVFIRERQPKRGTHTLWGRNPFVPPNVSVRGLPEESLALQGIVWEEDSPRAVINERILRVGDKIRGCHILQIEKNKVILSEAGRTFELRLRRKR